MKLPQDKPGRRQRNRREQQQQQHEENLEQQHTQTQMNDEELKKEKNLETYLSIYQNPICDDSDAENGADSQIEDNPSGVCKVWINKFKFMRKYQPWRWASFMKAGIEELTFYFSSFDMIRINVVDFINERTAA